MQFHELIELRIEKAITVCTISVSCLCVCVCVCVCVCSEVVGADLLWVGSAAWQCARSCRIWRMDHCSSDKVSFHLASPPPPSPPPTPLRGGGWRDEEGGGGMWEGPSPVAAS